MGIRIALLALCVFSASALDADLKDASSLKAAARLISHNLMTYYHGNETGQIPGILPGPPPLGNYYWWEGGALWGAMVDYWKYTGDTTYNGNTEQALVFQADPPLNAYMSMNWSASLGNDDQGFWGMSALLAAENKFPDPPSTGPGWLALAQGVFNTQAARWETTDCNGGLRWQILPNIGYDYKNSIPNSILFNMAARLARYTDNSTYTDWAIKVWDWIEGVQYIDADWNVYDGGYIPENCTNINPQQFSYIPGVLIQGAAFMYNYTNGSALWADRISGLTNRTLTFFFPNDTHVEIMCEHPDSVASCTEDMIAFRGFVARWLSQATVLAPIVKEPIQRVLTNSASNALKACQADGTCGFRWTTGGYDGYTGAGQQMNAMSAIVSLLVFMDADSGNAAPPVTNSTGGTSKGDPNAGSGGGNPLKPLDPPTTGDRVGAGILTAVVLIGLLTAMSWMMRDWGEGGSYTPISARRRLRPVSRGAPARGSGGSGLLTGGKESQTLMSSGALSPGLDRAASPMEKPAHA